MGKTEDNLMRMNKETLFLSCLYILSLFIFYYVSVSIDSGKWSFLYHFDDSGPVLPTFSLGFFCVFLFWLWGRSKKRDTRIITLVFLGIEVAIFFAMIIFLVIATATLPVPGGPGSITSNIDNFLINTALFLSLVLLLYRKEIKMKFFA